jgi:hypothetical protein
LQRAQLGGQVGFAWCLVDGGPQRSKPRCASSGSRG